MSGQDYIQSTLYREDFPASLFPWLESKKVKKMTVTSGRKCSELSENLRRVGSLVRTYLESCELPGEQFVRTWSVRDTLSPYLILKLRLSEQITGGKECSLWLGTPRATSSPRSEMFAEGRTPTPEEFVMLFPTPTAADHFKGAMASSQQTAGSRHSLDLPSAVKMFPTPRANQVHPVLTEELGKRNKSNLEEVVASKGSVGSQLNPTWVEWLMGFPPGWTDIGE